MSQVTIVSTATHHTGRPRDLIREALEDDPKSKITWDGKEVIGLCERCDAVLVEGDSTCPYCPDLPA